MSGAILPVVDYAKTLSFVSDDLLDRTNCTKAANRLTCLRNLSVPKSKHRLKN
jgi:hypothetical protein